MDEKTRRLRDIFLGVSDDGTVTERQEEGRGSLGARGDAEGRLREVVERMRERYDFRTSLRTDDLVTVVERFYAGDGDTAIARALGDPSRAKTVTRARADLHLLTEDDLDAPFDLDALRAALDEDESTADIADELGVSQSTVRRYGRFLEVQRDRRAVGDVYREEFETILGDRELGERLTEAVKRSGLEDATEDMETNVSF